MNYDYKALYEKNASFYKDSPLRITRLKLFNTVLTWLFAVTYAIFWLYAINSTTFPLKDLVSVFFAPSLALLLVSVMRICIERPRPYSEKGANITPLVSKKAKDGDSFPSRHIACAAAISMVFLSVLPVLGVFLLLCCFGLAYIRFSLGVHYPSDLTAGFAVGILCGITAFI